MERYELENHQADGSGHNKHHITQSLLKKINYNDIKKTLKGEKGPWKGGPVRRILRGK
jgi:hypothetical protein